MYKSEERYLLINRVIRKVPLDWQHPRDEAGHYITLQDRRYAYNTDELQELVATGHSLQELEGCLMPDFSDTPEDKLGLCVYETTTEGTPISPVVPNTPEGRWALAHFCATRIPVVGDRRLNAEGWAELLFGSDAVINLMTGRIEFALEEPEDGGEP